jgi:hypothetical protein
VLILPALKIRHRILTQNGIVSPIQVIPCLQELDVHLKVLPTSDSGLGCPVQVAQVAGDYVSAFPSIRTFRLMVQWAIRAQPGSQALEEMQGDPTERLIERAADGFGRLDDLLADRGLLNSLKEVEIGFYPITILPGIYFIAWKMTDIKKVKSLQDLLRREAMDVFCKTSNDVDVVMSLITDKAFT